MKLKKETSYLFSGFGNADVYRKNNIFLNGYCLLKSWVINPRGYCIYWGDTEFHIN
jgi:hypothetical protein